RPPGRLLARPGRHFEGRGSAAAAHRKGAASSPARGGRGARPRPSPDPPPAISSGVGGRGVSAYEERNAGPKAGAAPASQPPPAGNAARAGVIARPRPSPRKDPLPAAEPHEARCRPLTTKNVTRGRKRAPLPAINPAGSAPRLRQRRQALAEAGRPPTCR